MYEVKKRFEISAAHKLDLDYDSKCTNFHGHNWIIERYNFINNLVVKLVLNFAFDVCKIKNHTVFVKSFTLKIYVNYPVVTMKISTF